MALQFDQLNNQLKTNDSTNANASMTLTPSGTGSVLLNGTGQNLLLQSNSLTNASWATSVASVTGSQTDPFGGTTAALITATATGAAGIGQSPTLTSQTYTLSVYAKAGTSTWLRLFGPYPTSSFAWFNLSTGVLGTVQTGLTATITSVGNGWYRCSMTGIGNGAIGLRIADADNSTTATSGTTAYFCAPQLEIGSTANTYTPTTTTAIYNAPVLSFSGVSNIGLQSDGSLYVSPAGTGALQAQKTDSTATGGNARGANAVDWSTIRGSASQVASGSYAVVCGGLSATNNSFGGVIVGGNNNQQSGAYAFLGAGESNTVQGTDAVLIGGKSNSSAGYFNFIGGGFTNSGTANAAVVSALATQQVTVGSLQIALTATNASIKVGQLLTGTGIVSYTYVTSAVATNTVSAMTSTISTTTLSVTALTGTMYIGTVLTGGSISPATAYVTAQLTATNAAAASPTASASSGSTTLVVSSATGIAVGQFVQPITGINTNTYVLAISGTSITISQATTGVITAGTAINFYTAGNTGTYSLNTSSTGTPTGGTSYTFGISQSASATGTPALSFYTPHGVVVGGGNNTATGSYSFIGGGGDAGTAANRNTASADWATVCGGIKNTSSNIYATIGGGKENTASGIGSFIGGGGAYQSTGTGFGNTTTNGASVIVGGISNNNSSFVGFIGGGYTNNASGSNYATIVGGQSNIANSNYSFVSAGYYGTTRGIEGNHVFPACNVPIASASGVSQSALLILGTQTTDATATVLRSNSSAASGTNQVILPNNSAYYFKGEIISGVTGGGNTKGWYIEGVIKRGAGVGTTALVGSPTVTSLYADAGASTWTVAVTADTTNGGLAVTFTGQASTTIRTVCQIRTTEMTY
jgi:hypothetical protein